MEVFYSRYKLTPIKRINRLSSMDQKEGVYLSATIDGKKVFADYFPHLPLGDETVESFLENFPKQNTEYQQKLHLLLKEDLHYQNYPSKKFRNHQLWSGSEPITSPVIKYKMLHPNDHTFHDALSRGIRVRLDGNAMFNKSNVNQLLDPLLPEWRKYIDYVEDPLSDSDWSAFPLRRARDFITGTPFDIYIYKPNCEMKPNWPELIFSAYLGSSLGSWHAYCEMIGTVNSNIVQGIIGLGFYEELEDFYRGDFNSGFYPDLALIGKMYKNLENREWKKLCSM
ncbi:MAG: hypothetical protein ACJ76H_13480 [Bacteriovoracaceae bacterium]